MYFFLMVFSGTGACQSNGVTEGSLWSFERAPSCMTFTSCFWFAVSDWNTALCFSTGSSISKRFSSWQKAGGKQKFWVSCSCFLSIQFQGHNIKEPKKIPNKELKETKYFFWPSSPQYHLKPTLEGRHFPLSINPAFERVFFACWRASRLGSFLAFHWGCSCMQSNALSVPFQSTTIFLQSLLIWKKSIFHFPECVLFALCSWLTYKICWHLCLLPSPLNFSC